MLHGSGLRRLAYKALANLCNHGGSRHLRPVYLACRALRHRRHSLRQESLPGVPLLCAGLSDSRRHNVERGHPARRT